MSLRPLETARALAVVTVAWSSSARADDKTVTTSAELTAAIGAAKAGDTITLADGVYAMGDVSCAASGARSRCGARRRSEPASSSTRSRAFT
ncbi:MAG: hypothetical protein FJ095_16895 [Deltaproteobacteria bacterium]|nr:hypothetical protein [Deltaproteobacteria bacterium]